MIHTFDPKMSLRDNWRIGADIAFAAWEYAGHNHREEFRDCGPAPHRTAALAWTRIRELTEALSKGEFIALAVASDDQTAAVIRIPEVTFDASDLRIDHERMTICALGRTYLDVRICKFDAQERTAHAKHQKPGRPDQLAMLLHAWRELKAENPDFMNWPKSRQNAEAQEKVAALYRGRFPGNSRPGESTVRRHRRANRDLFD
jgi:hypothetical protein